LQPGKRDGDPLARRQIAEPADQIDRAGLVWLEHMADRMARAQPRPQREAGEVVRQIDLRAQQEELGIDHGEAMPVEPRAHFGFALRRDRGENEFPLLPGDRHVRGVGEQTDCAVAAGGGDLDQVERRDVHRGELMEAKPAGHRAHSTPNRSTRCEVLPSGSSRRATR
jgi:hypothetical protein